MKISLSGHESSPVGTLSAANAGNVPNFDSLARAYRWLEYFSFGPFLWRCRSYYLGELSHCRRALVLGDGDGRFTARLLRTNPEIRITAIDGSARMIESLRRAAGEHQDRLTTQVADLRTSKLLISEQFDLIVTHFFLDCLTTPEVSELAARLGSMVTPDALWLVSEFDVPDTPFGHAVAAPLVASLYFAFRCLTGLKLRQLPNHGRALEGAGWMVRVEHKQLRGLLLSQLWRRWEQNSG